MNLFQDTKEYTKKESKALAENIYRIEHVDYVTRKTWSIEGKKEWRLSADVRLEKSNDCLTWHLWKTYDDQARSFFKSVPALNLSVDSIYQILQAQVWTCI